MKTVLLVGKIEKGQKASDGGSIKVALYKQCLEQCGINVILLNLYKWKKRLIRNVIFLMSNIKKSDSILIMGGPNGSRKLIPLINFFNHFHKKRTVYCPLGIGTAENIIKKLDLEQTNKFINCENFYNIKDKKMARSLSKLSCIIPQNQTLTKFYRCFYKLNNVETLLNFRNVKIVPRSFIKHNPFKIIYLSRIAENKGIFLLFDAISSLNDAALDVYGDIQLSEEQKVRFDNFIESNPNVRYCGVCDSSQSIRLLTEYDLFCLPTKYVGEGTSGSYIESLIAGTPVLLSSYSQAKELVNDGENGFLFEINNPVSLREKIESIMNQNLKDVSKKEQLEAQRYVFSFNKDVFIKAIMGVSLNHE